MKNDILHSGKLFQIQREYNYQRHMDKMNEISRKRTSNILPKSSPFLPTYPSSYKIENQLRVKQQNHRLVKKLYQITNRKKPQILSPQDTTVIKYSSLHKKYNEYYRQEKQKQIQQQNERIVQKLLQRRRANKNNNDYSRDEDDVFLLRKSRSKNKGKDKSRDSMEKSRESMEKSRERVKKNKSLMDKRNNQSLLENKINKKDKVKTAKNDDQRHRNYSTLLPNIEKVKDKSNPQLNYKNHTIDHGDLLSMLKKHQKQYKEVKKEELKEVKKEEQKQNVSTPKNPESVIQPKNDISDKYSMEQFEEAQYQNTRQEKPHQIQKPNNQGIKQKDPAPQNNPAKQPKNPEITQQLQLTQQHSIIQQQVKPPTTNIMDPNLKFQKMAKQKKTKKRQKISKIKEEDQYADEQFEVDIKEQ